MSLFHIPTTKHMKLDEFEQAQSQATSQVTTCSGLMGGLLGNGGGLLGNGVGLYANGGDYMLIMGTTY